MKLDHISRIAAVALLFVLPAYAGQDAAPANLQALANKLSDLRGACVTQAKKAHMAYSLAQYKQNLDQQLAAAQIDQDARVYAIGHGSRETTQHMFNQMDANQKAAKAKDQEIQRKGDADAADVTACVNDAEAQGKAAYSGYKKAHAKHHEDAADLMTAWLTNLGTVSMERPTGTPDTATAWKTAKTKAEVAAL